MNLELCTDRVEGAIFAEKYGFKRIELCAALSEGGLTPSFGLIKRCAEASTVEVHAMIRPRGGNFQCDPEELRVMQDDIRAAATAGARGVVFGILTPSLEVADSNQTLVELAHSLGMQTTFHRAFDQVADPHLAAKKLIELRFDRLLTSGLQDKAIEGLPLLKTLQQDFGGALEIMAGSGVNPDNARAFAEVGIENLHFTSQNANVDALMPGMGENKSTDEIKMKAIRDLFF